MYFITQFVPKEATLISIYSKSYFGICRHLGSQLAELERVIERMMEADFVEFATANLGRTAEDDMGNEDLVDEVFSNRPTKGLV